MCPSVRLNTHTFIYKQVEVGY